jgi:hypothetical protein
MNSALECSAGPVSDPDLMPLDGFELAGGAIPTAMVDGQERRQRGARSRGRAREASSAEADDRAAGRGERGAETLFTTARRPRHHERSRSNLPTLLERRSPGPHTSSSRGHRTCGPASGERPAAHRRFDHRVRRVHAVRVHPHGRLRVLDALRRVRSVAEAEPDRVAGGDLSVDVRHDRPERQAEFQRAKADHDFATEAQELRSNTELTRAVYTLTAELHRRVLGDMRERGSPGEGPEE